MQTLEQIRREGLAALRARLGRAGMVRFLDQFDTGCGDYSKGRHEWVDATTLAEIQDMKAGRDFSKVDVKSSLSDLKD